MFIETIGELNSLKKNTFPKSFWDTERVVSGLLSKLFWRGSQNCILSVQMTNLRKNKILEETFFISLPDIQWNYFGFVKNFSAGLSKLHSTCRAEHFEEKFVRKKNTIIVFEHWAEKFSAFWPKFLDRVVKTAFYVAMGTVRTFLKKVSFSSFWDIELKKSFSLKKVNFLIFFGDWAEIFRVSGTIFLAGLSKLHYTCP